MNDNTLITITTDGIKKSITLAELAVYLEGTFTVKRSVYEKRKEKVEDEANG